MNLQEFQKEVLRTLFPLGSLLKDSLHATTGMANELMKEVFPAILEGNIEELKSELADVQWYACAYAHVHNIPLPESFKPVGMEVDACIAIGALLNYDNKVLLHEDLTRYTLNKGSLGFYLGNALRATEGVAKHFKIDMADARRCCIAKLELRHAEGFNKHNADNKNLGEEGRALGGLLP